MSLHCSIIKNSLCTKCTLETLPNLIKFFFNSSVLWMLHFSRRIFPGFPTVSSTLSKWHQLFHPRELSRCIMRVDLFFSLSSVLKFSLTPLPWTYTGCFCKPTSGKDLPDAPYMRLHDAPARCRI